MNLLPTTRTYFRRAQRSRRLIGRPYVRSGVAWIIEQHGVFQLYYYGDGMGVDKNVCEIYRGH